MVQKEIRRENFFRSVPIKNILEIESLALGFDAEKRKEVLANYSELAAKLTQGIKDFNISERSLYEKLSSLFYNQMLFEPSDELLLSLSVISHRFSCFGSSLLFADVITKSGRPVDFVFTEDHIFIIGKEFAFQTTRGINSVESMESAMNEFPDARRTNGDKELLLSLVYRQCAGYLSSLEQLHLTDHSLESKIDMFLRMAESYADATAGTYWSEHMLKDAKR
ncbi:MAG: hypothetical protein ACP5MC_01240 [Candidatus Micrarchaeia archaeon]